MPILPILMPCDIGFQSEPALPQKDETGPDAPVSRAAGTACYTGNLDIPLS